MNKKRGITLASLALATAILSGCSSKQAMMSTKAPTHGIYGWINTYLGVPMQHLMEWLAHHLGNNYGWAIIAIVVIVRLILLPVMMSQMKRSTMMQEKMAMVQPQIRSLQAQLKQAKTPEEQAAVNRAMMRLYRDNNISMTGGIGCLPLLIQLPIFTGLYDAIRYSPDLFNASFMGIHLGQPSIVLAILSFVAYLAQSWLSLVGLPDSQKKQMRAMMIFSPLMIFFICMSSSAGLGLYFFIGGIFAILQTWLINAYRPRLKKQIQAEAKQHPVKSVVVAQPKQENAQEKYSANVAQLKGNANRPQRNEGKQRNAGKQRNVGKQHHHPQQH